MVNKIKLNIGAGSTTYTGFINCDYSDQYNPDYVFDLEKDQWPFEDNSVTHVIAHHVLEHLGEGYFHALKELYRVCDSGAIIDIKVPHYTHHNFFHDATHRRAITVPGLSMFSQKINNRDFLANSATSRLGQYLNIDLELITYSYMPDDRYKEILYGKTVEEIEAFAYEKNNIISEIWIKMMAIKGTRAEQINAYYLNYLNRKVDKDGLNFYLNSGMPMEQILNSIKSSEEYGNIK
jgi:predicted SAM-dependent methyltransferase